MRWLLNTRRYYWVLHKYVHYLKHLVAAAWRRGTGDSSWPVRALVMYQFKVSVGHIPLLTVVGWIWVSTEGPAAWYEMLKTMLICVTPSKAVVTIWTTRFHVRKFYTEAKYWIHQARSPNCDKRLLVSWCLCLVCRSAWNNSAPTGRVFV